MPAWRGRSQEPVIFGDPWVTRMEKALLGEVHGETSMGILIYPSHVGSCLVADIPTEDSGLSSAVNVFILALMLIAKPIFRQRLGSRFPFAGAISNH